jgi:3-oxoacyl-[acyl-carrier protein] reductase
VTETDYEKNFLINFKAPLFITQSLLFPENKFIKKGASIVFITSPNCFLGGSFRNVLYSSSKSALLGLSKCLAKELAPGIRVNVVAPGYIDTKMLREKTTKKVLEQRRKNILLQRFGKPEDIAQLIKFLVSEESTYITGQTIQSNGGLILT